MGFMTLEDFTDELLTVGGGGGHSPNRLKRYANAGYFEVAGRADFSALVDRDTVVLVDGDESYPLPAGLLGLIAVRNTTSPKRLREVSMENFFLYDVTTEDAPTHFAHDTVNLYVHPTPNATYAGDVLEIVYRKEPTALSAQTDTTVLPGTFDMAVMAFAKYYYLQNLGRNEEARNWLIRGTNVLNGAISDLARFYEGEGRVGVGVAWDASDLEEEP